MAVSPWPYHPGRVAMVVSPRPYHRGRIAMAVSPWSYHPGHIALDLSSWTDRLGRTGLRLDWLSRSGSNDLMWLSTTAPTFSLSTSLPRTLSNVMLTRVPHASNLVYIYIYIYICITCIHVHHIRGMGRRCKHCLRVFRESSASLP